MLDVCDIIIIYQELNIHPIRKLLCMCCHASYIYIVLLCPAKGNSHWSVILVFCAGIMCVLFKFSPEDILINKHAGR